jgi:hypothetical protein
LKNHRSQTQVALALALSPIHAHLCRDLRNPLPRDAEVLPDGLIAESRIIEHRTEPWDRFFSVETAERRTFLVHWHVRTRCKKPVACETRSTTEGDSSQGGLRQIDLADLLDGLAEMFN